MAAIRSEIWYQLVNGVAASCMSQVIPQLTSSYPAR